MVLALLPTVALADATENCTDPDCSHAAAIGSTHYDTLAEAIAAVSIDGTETTIKMLADITGMTTGQILTIASGRNVVLDMAGHSITVASAFTGRPIVNKGTLKVTGNGTIDSTASESGGYGAINNFGTLTIENGTFRGATYANGSAIYNRAGATLTINDGTFDTATRAVANDNQATINGGSFTGTTCSRCNQKIWAYTIVNYGTNARLVINGGTFIGTQGAVSSSVGYLEVNGGTFKTQDCSNNHGAIFYALYAAGEAGEVECVINGGTFETSGSIAAVLIGNDNKNGDGGINAQATAYVNGGTFTAPEGVPALKGAAETGDPVITGGTFSSDVSAYVTGSAKQEILADGTYTVRPLTANDPESVAKVNDTYYTTLAAAITAAQNGNTVTLLKDVTVTKTVTIEKSLTIDLGGKTLTGEKCRMLHITSGALELTGTGTVKSTGIAVGSSVIRVGDNYGDARSVALVIGSNVVIDAPASYGVGAFGTATTETVTINGTVTSTAPANDDYDGCAVSTLGNDTTSSTITIKEGAKISATNTNAIYLPSGTLIVEGGEITGTTGIYVKSGSTTITGGTITGNGEAKDYNYYGNGGISTGDALVVDSCGYPNGDPQVSVTGGTFTSTNAKAVASYATEGNSAVTNFITGGTFSSDPTAYVAGGYIAKKNSETEYAVIAKSGLTSGVYMSNPTGATAANHYVTKNNDDETWTVFYVAPYVAPTYSITVDSAKHGDVTVSPKNASKGATVTITVEPDKGYTLETLTVTDKNGDEIELTNKGDGKYTFTMPAGKVYVEATFMEDNSMLNFFVDVFPGDYYYDAVLWAAKNGITGGVDAAHFAPNATCTRAQVVTFLWRAAGSPAPKSSMMPFTDIPAGSYYETAVLWAAENGITGGTGNNAFSPDATCSRGQIVTFLWRALGSLAAGTVNPFTDVAADAYYNTAVLWAAENGITGGTGDNAFSPDADCTRAQIVTFLWRALAE